MLRIFGIALATLCIFTASFADEAPQAARCQLKELASLTLIQAPDGAPLAPVSLQDRPALMLLTLEHGPPVLFSDAADALPLSGSSHATIVGEVVSYSTFKLGRIQFSAVEFVLKKRRGQYGPASVNGLPVIGALGATLLSRMDFELDLAHGRLNLFSQEHATGCGAYWADKYAENPTAFEPLGELTMVVKLDGKLMSASLDPSIAISEITTNVTKSLFGFDASAPDVETVAGADGTSQHQFVAMSLTSGNLSAINTRVRLGKSSNSGCYLNTGSESKAADYTNCLGLHPLVIGRNILSRLRLYFAPKEKKVYYTVADASPGS